MTLSTHPIDIRRGGHLTRRYGHWYNEHTSTDLLTHSSLPSFSLPFSLPLLSLLSSLTRDF